MNAVMLLLRTLSGLGARLHYHGDFDGEGIRIAAYVIDKTGARAWRMSAQDYRAAWQERVVGPAPGRITDAPWDPALAESLRRRQEAVVEERVAAVLLEDLAAGVLSGHRGSI